MGVNSQGCEYRADGEGAAIRACRRGSHQDEGFLKQVMSILTAEGVRESQVRE